MPAKPFDDPYQNLAAAILRKASREAQSPDFGTAERAKMLLRGELGKMLMRVCGLDYEAVMEWFELNQMEV